MKKSNLMDLLIAYDKANKHLEKFNNDEEYRKKIINKKIYEIYQKNT